MSIRKNPNIVKFVCGCFVIFKFIFIMAQGKVKFFNEQKGFGFITGKDGKDIFVHVSGLIDEVRENDDVSYDMKEGKKGLNAVNVQLLS
jgi:CspA family cold shock protein